MGKAKKRQLADSETDSEEEAKKLPPTARRSDDPPPKRAKWINRQRVLIFAVRGITFQDRHLMFNLRTLLPHSKSENKMEKNRAITVINEMCEMRHCNKCVFFESVKHRDLYAWFSNIPDGPSAKFLVENVHTMEQLNLSGNCLKGSRPLLSFDPNFEAEPHYKLIKELFVQIFSTPHYHPKSQPFIDHVMTFSILDQRIWFRNYQIMEEDGSVVEIGPRFVLQPIKIFASSFGGKTLWANPSYVSPARKRSLMRKAASQKYVERTEQRMYTEKNQPEEYYNFDPVGEVFKEDPKEHVQKAQGSLQNKKPKSVNKKFKKKNKLKIQQ